MRIFGCRADDGGKISWYIMFSSVKSAVITGITAREVSVEADISEGLPMFSLIGFLSSEVREAQDRVRSAMRSAGLHLPAKRITVNLAPADIRKAGCGFDLAIAAALLGAMGYADPDALKTVLFIGELGLDGRVRPVHGILAMVSQAVSFGCTSCIIPEKNLAEGSFGKTTPVFGVSHLTDMIRFLNGTADLKRAEDSRYLLRSSGVNSSLPDFSDLKGQSMVKRAAEIAVSGRHHLLMIGPPGAGKTMAAKRIPSILPGFSDEEILEVSRIYSIAGLLPPGDGLITSPPFRAPHHTITSPAMAGGGVYPKPGEVTLAHLGVLFLDELPEFRQETLETLRQPLEERRINISRSSGMYEFPADFILAAAMNPCRCGYYPDRTRCSCSAVDIRNYLERISRPLLDRIDLCVEVPETKYEQIRQKQEEESSAVIRARVEEARERQKKRYKGTIFRCNGDLDLKAVGIYCTLGTQEERLMKDVYNRMRLTGRSYVKILKSARTIADLAHSDRITKEHLSEAVGYRTIDRQYWGKEV